MFKNQKWSIVGDLRKPSSRLGALYTNGQFFLAGFHLTWVLFLSEQYIAKYWYCSSNILPEIDLIRKFSHWPKSEQYIARNWQYIASIFSILILILQFLNSQYWYDMDNINILLQLWRTIDHELIKNSVTYEYFRDIEVYKFKNDMINFTRSAVPYLSGHFDYNYGVSPLFAVDGNFCSKSVV